MKARKLGRLQSGFLHYMLTNGAAQRPRKVFRVPKCAESWRIAESLERRGLIRIVSRDRDTYRVTLTQ